MSVAFVPPAFHGMQPEFVRGIIKGKEAKANDHPT